jgi:hypothetical protein
MSLAESVSDVVRQHEALGQEILDLVEEESRALASGSPGLPDSTSARKRALLPRLEASLRQLRLHREAWLRIPPEERARHPQVASQLRSTQDLLLRVIVRDRENEQLVLRGGHVPPRQLAKVQAVSRPHYVADLYRRHVPSSSSSSAA